jgi:monofunctional biosynthetic peptidoglycan transglycosylase
LKNVLKKTLRIVLYLFAASLLYVVICKWIFPPITLTQINAIIEGHGLKRDYISWDEIPDNIKLAAIASEDQLFMQHNGYDWKALEKSLDDKPAKKKKKNKRAKGTAASTISQQTAKNVFLWQGQGVLKYVRKGFEFFYTGCIELVWGKKRILEVYLNVIEMGPGIYGVEAAAQAYFNKPAKKLTKAEAAQIIACLPNPKRFTVKPMSRRVGWRYPQIMRQMNNMDDYPEVRQLLRD